MWNSGRIRLLYGLLTLTAMAGGCQRGLTWDLAPVEGTVTKDGRPQVGIEVVFLPDADIHGPQSSSITDEAGRYSLRVDGGGDGAIVCTHRVCLYDTRRAALRFIDRLSKEKRKEFNQEAAPVPLRVPASYGRPNETPLRVEVHSGPQVIDLEVK